MTLPRIFYASDLEEYGWSLYLTDIRNDDVRVRCDVRRDGKVTNVSLHGTTVGPSLNLSKAL